MNKSAGPEKVFNLIMYLAIARQSQRNGFISFTAYQPPKLKCHKKLLPIIGWSMTARKKPHLYLVFSI